MFPVYAYRELLSTARGQVLKSQFLLIETLLTVALLTVV